MDLWKQRTIIPLPPLGALQPLASLAAMPPSAASSASAAAAAAAASSPSAARTEELIAHAETGAGMGVWSARVEVTADNAHRVTEFANIPRSYGTVWHVLRMKCTMYDVCDLRNVL